MTFEERNSNKPMARGLDTEMMIQTVKDSLSTSPFKKRVTFEEDETDFLDSDILEFSEEKQTAQAIIETPASHFKSLRNSRFFFAKDVENLQLPQTEENIFTNENPVTQTPYSTHPLVYPTMSSHRLLLTNRQTDPENIPQNRHHNSQPAIFKKKVVHMAEGSVNESIRSKSSKEKKIQAAYRATLNFNFYPRYFKAFGVSFYLTLIAIFSTQIIYHNIINQTVQNLVGKKEVLSNSQLTNFYLIQTAGVFRVLEDTIKQRFTVSELGLFNIPTLYYASATSTILFNLNNANQDLLGSTDTLSQENRQQIFKSDVKIYDNYFDSSDQSFTSLTNFEATNRIIEAGLGLAERTKVNLTSSLGDFGFIYRNTLNDLLLKNSMISSFFSESFMDEFKQIKTITDNYLIATPMFILAGTIVLIIIILKQYHEEKLNLAAVTKLNPLRLKEILASIKDFITIVEAEELVSEEFLDKILDEEEKPRKEKFNKKADIKRTSDKSFNEKGITRKCLTLLFKTVLIIIGIALTFIIHLLIVKRSVEFFKFKQSQIFLSDYLRAQTYLSEIASQEMFSAPTNAEVENTQLETWTVDSIQKMRNLKVHVSTAFQNEDGSYDPEIQDIVFENGCPSGVLVNNQQSCDYLARKSMKTGLIYLLSSLEDILNTRLNKYQQSDKSAQALRNIEGADFEPLLAISLVVVQQCYVISETINVSVDENLAQSNEKRQITTALTMSLFLILGIVIWTVTIRKLKKNYNTFKNVLRVLPADLAFSSFILKTFLKNTSGGSLDSIKSYI